MTWLRARSLLLLLCASGALGICVPGEAAAQDAGFGRFCRQWLGKLAEREQHNLAVAAARAAGPPGAAVVLDYVGYAHELLGCDARPAGPPGNFLGRLSYHELRLRRRGPSPKAARAGPREVLARVKVTEIFRFDGRRWQY